MGESYIDKNFHNWYWAVELWIFDYTFIKSNLSMHKIFQIPKLNMLTNVW